MNGQFAQLYVRERASGRVLARGGAGVVLFVHGAGTPAEVAFDVPFGDYSWMGYLADAGFDVFSVDMTGYGRSTRPSAMNDPCNLAQESADAVRADADRRRLARRPIPSAATTIASDWNDIDAVVDYVRALRRRRSRQPGSLVARRTARRRLCGAAPRQGAETCPARARIRRERQATILQRSRRRARR